MRVLLTGATGFIGQHLLRALLRDGHDIVACARDPGPWRTRLPEATWIRCDFAVDQGAEAWPPRLVGIDMVVNAVGILRESRGQRFADLHTGTPCALFDAAARSRIRRLLQISALGADDRARSAYHRSKRDADRHLPSLDAEPVFLYPSLVLGRGGGSWSLFTALAALPVIPLIADGGQRLQPIYIDDLVESVVRVVRRWPPGGARLAAVGAAPLTLADVLRGLRRRLGPRPVLEE